MSNYVHCKGCDDKVKKSKNTKCSMEDCENYICKDCQKSEYVFHEWCHAPTRCEECKKMVCNDCIVFCHYCANLNKEYKFYCRACAPDDIDRNDCRYHDWMKCGKEHDGNSYEYEGKTIDCPECCANRNYCGRSS